jgi:6-phosphogluconolactonase (cycloisomerase 2 family)
MAHGSTIDTFEVGGDGRLRYSTNVAAGGEGNFPGPPIAPATDMQGLTLHPSLPLLYASDIGSTLGPGNTIFSFSLDPDSGQLTLMNTLLLPPQDSGGAFTTAANLQFTPNGKFAYVANVSSAQFAIFPLTADSAGNLSLNGGAVAAAGTVGANQFFLHSNPLAIDPQGRWLYAPVTSAPLGYVQAWSILADGTLAPLGLFPTPGTNDGGVALAMDPTGHFLYVANSFDKSITQMSIDQTSGALTPLTPANVPVNGGHSPPAALAIDPSGHNLYVVEQFSLGGHPHGGIASFAIGSDGTLSANGPDVLLTGNPAAVYPGGLVIDPQGKFLYVLSTTGQGPLLAYTIGANGQLAPNPGPAANPSNPAPPALNPSDGNSIRGNYSFDSKISGAGFAAGGVALYSSAAPRVSPTELAFVINNNTGQAQGSVSSFHVDAASGVLTPAATPSVATGKGPVAGAIARTRNGGLALYVANYLDTTGSATGTVSTYTVGADGSLTPLNTISNLGIGLNGPLAMAVDPGNRFLFVLNDGNQAAVPGGRATASAVNPNIVVYNINADGSLSLQTFSSFVPVTTDTLRLNSMSMDPTGSYLFVTGLDMTTSKSVVVGFTVDQLMGFVNPVQGAGGALLSYGTLADNPLGCWPDATGNFVYVANADGSVNGYAINANTAQGFNQGELGTLVTGSTVVTGTSELSFLAGDPLGGFLFGTSPGSSPAAVSPWTVQAGYGALTGGTAVTGPSSPAGAAVDASGQFLYVTDNSASGTVFQYGISASGAPTPLSTPSVAAGANPVQIVTWPTVR